MPVSTDGVLLGAWIDIDQARSILDIGTGTGLLSLMCVQRFPESTVTAIEIDHMAAEAALQNFSQSAWSDRLELIQKNILEWESPSAFDTIICNPPYFNFGEQSPSAQRATARHTDSLNHRDLLAKSWNVLKPRGKANFILPEFEGEQFIQLALSMGWYLSRLCRVKPNENKPINRLVFEISKNQCHCQESELTIRHSGSYSSEFIALTKEFYLKM